MRALHPAAVALSSVCSRQGAWTGSFPLPGPDEDALSIEGMAFVPSDERVFYRLDSTEDAQRRRRRLKRNYKGTTHPEAVIHVDGGGTGACVTLSGQRASQAARAPHTLGRVTEDLVYATAEAVSPAATSPVADLGSTVDLALTKSVNIRRSLPSESDLAEATDDGAGADDATEAATSAGSAPSTALAPRRAASAATTPSTSDLAFTEADLVSAAPTEAQGALHFLPWSAAPAAGGC